MKIKTKTPVGGHRTGAIERTTAGNCQIIYNDKVSSRQAVPIYSSFGRVVGYVIDEEFLKSINGSRHLLRYPPAIAFDACSLQQAEQAGATIVRVVDQETGIVYKAELTHILEVGTAFDRGYGQQVYLELDGWTKQKCGGGLQLALFGGES